MSLCLLLSLNTGDNVTDEQIGALLRADGKVNLLTARYKA